MTELSEVSNPSTGRFVESAAPVTEQTENTDQQIIKITEDKVRLILHDHITIMEKQKEWITPFGIFLTIVITLLTTSFNTFYFDASTWKAIFVICGFLSLIWLVKASCQALNSEGIDDIIDKFKNKKIQKETILGKCCNTLKSRVVSLLQQI
jgi:hypothetical protein